MQGMKHSYHALQNSWIFVLLVMPAWFIASNTVECRAEQVNCDTCHSDLSAKKNRHAAVQMGCPSCHSGIDAADIPHKKTNKVAKGLASEPPALCYGCHDKGVFSKKTVHPALQMGCLSCHNPHASDNEKLLITPMPDLCFTCHDKAKFSGAVVHSPVSIGLCTSCHDPHASAQEKLLKASMPDLCFTCHDKGPFTRKTVHAPVAGGMCAGCHSPHASEEQKLLLKRPISVCLECHAEVMKTPHAVTGFSARGGHYLGSVKKGKKVVKDPVRKDSEFYCGSCHEPHSSDWGKLFRYKAASTMGLCQYCHKY